MSQNYTSSNDALGESPAFMDFQQNLSLAARVDRPVLLVGERGTGKELAAARLHYLSGRWKEPYVPVNCAALPPSLLESELFGHEPGAFTGASKVRKGRFEEAHGGTLFLDEIGLVPMEVQEKILRTVEYGRFSRVGSSQEKEVDVRIIGATNADLPELCRRGKFKEDLLDRLSFEVLYLPPLRYRSTDITLLASHFAMRMSRELGKIDVPEFSPELIQKIQDYSWPGNVRELKNAVERAVYKTEGLLIEEMELNPFSNPYQKLSAASSGSLNQNRPPRETQSPAAMPPETQTSESGGSIEDKYAEVPLEEYKETMLKLELQFIRRALEESRFSQKKAAGALGLSYDQFRGLYKKYQADLNSENSESQD